MEQFEIIEARIKDKLNLCKNRDILTKTSFLTLSEQDVFFKMLKNDGYPLDTISYQGVEFLLYGGNETSDRKNLFFLPSYLTKSDLIEGINNGNEISIIHISPKNPKFSEKLSHRDYLGSLMNLGLKREEFGDLIIKDDGAYIFVNSRSSKIVLDSLEKVRNTSVKKEIKSIKDCDLKIKFEDMVINVSSNRLDAIIGEVFHISRGKASEFIEKEFAYVNDEIKTNKALELKEGNRVSLRGKGKFKFIEIQNKTRKDRLIILVKKYI